MSIFEAIILGIVQGLTEFLPVSSSGHLIIFKEVFGLEPSVSFDVLLHLATLIPLMYVFRETIFELIKKPFQKMTLLIIVGTLPAVVAQLLFGDVIEGLLGNARVLPICFAITGIFLMLADRIKDTHKKEKDMTAIDAVLIGCMQVIGIAPGVSRSGSTIFGSLLRKLDRETAAKFSFLLAIPAILGGFVLHLFEFIDDPSTFNVELAPTIFGFVAAMLAGYLAISYMLKLIKKAKLVYFSYYVFALALFILLDQYIFNIFFS
jgi:undecaprenyl-diphosphatase